MLLQPCWYPKYSYLLLLLQQSIQIGKFYSILWIFFLPFKFLTGEQSKRRIIGLSAWDRNVKDLLLDAKVSILLSIPACGSWEHQLEKCSPTANVTLQDFNNFCASGSEKAVWFLSNNVDVLPNQLLILAISRQQGYFCSITMYLCLLEPESHCNPMEKLFLGDSDVTITSGDLSIYWGFNWTWKRREVTLY